MNLGKLNFSLGGVKSEPVKLNLEKKDVKVNKFDDFNLDEKLAENNAPKLSPKKSILSFMERKLSNSEESFFSLNK